MSNCHKVRELLHSDTVNMVGPALGTVFFMQSESGRHKACSQSCTYRFWVSVLSKQAFKNALTWEIEGYFVADQSHNKNKETEAFSGAALSGFTSVSHIVGIHQWLWHAVRAC